jgi:hypothetical protein
VAIENSDDESNHVIAGDIISPSTTGQAAEAILGFLQNLPSN